MSTGDFQDWTGNILDIGPVYPFVGSEVFLWIVGLACWIGWHLWQARFESKTYREDMEKLSKNDNLARVLKGEKLL
jgi:hypothetical protein